MCLRRALLASAAMVAAVMISPRVFAQAAGGLEEITVTAQRRPERLQDVPVSVSAFSPTEMERRNVYSTRDLIQYVPNLQGNNNTGLGTANVYFLRGLGNTESIATFDPPIGTYIDDIYLARQNMNNFSFFDVDSIEVLRGPQGTLFGRNTSGGAINVRMRKPAEKFGGSAEVAYGRYNTIETRATVDVPVSPKLLTQVSAFYTNGEGYVNDVTTGQKLNGTHAWGVRASAHLAASDVMSWDVAFNHIYENSLNLLNFTCRMFDSGYATPGAAANCQGRFAVTGLAQAGGRSSLSNVLISVPGAGLVPYNLSGNLANQPLGNQSSLTLVSSNLQAQFDHLTLNAITGYWRLDQKYLFEFQDGRVGRSLAAPNPPIPYIVNQAGVISPNGSFALANHAVSEAISQELKATGDIRDNFIKYVAGAYFYHDRNDTDYADIITSFLPPIAPQTAASPRPYFSFVSGDRFLDNKTTSIAGYAQADIFFTQKFFGTAGIRYTDERKPIHIADLRPAAVGPIINGVVRTDLRLDTANLAAQGFPQELVTKLWTPRFALNFKPNDDSLVFASATRGFRSGGYNVRGGDISSFAPFFAEKVWSYEAGAKTQFMDRRIRANLTLFDEEVSGFQLPSSFVQANGTPTFITQNAADFRDRGGELELSALPVERLNTFVSVGYQDARYRNIPGSTRAQQAACLAARAAGQTGSGTVCAVGIVTYDGRIATPSRVPHWTIAAGASYEIPVGRGLNVVPSVNISHQSSSESAAANLSFYVNNAGLVNVGGDGAFIAGSHTAPFTVVNASLAVESEDKMWRVSAECANCLGEVWSQSSISGYSFINPPGTWTLRVRKRF